MIRGGSQRSGKAHAEHMDRETAQHLRPRHPAAACRRKRDDHEVHEGVDDHAVDRSKEQRPRVQRRPRRIDNAT